VKDNSEQGQGNGKKTFLYNLWPTIFTPPLVGIVTETNLCFLFSAKH
jgi:hypothetical protein